MRILIWNISWVLAKSNPHLVCRPVIHPTESVPRSNWPGWYYRESHQMLQILEQCFSITSVQKCMAPSSFDSYTSITHQLTHTSTTVDSHTSITHQWTHTSTTVDTHKHYTSITHQLTGYAGSLNSFSSCSIISNPFKAGRSILFTTVKMGSLRIRATWNGRV
jgi:hypothetical protein